MKIKGARRAGKTTQALQSFIRQVQAGKRSLYVAGDYVIMDIKTYKEAERKLRAIRRASENLRDVLNEWYPVEKGG